MRHIEYHVKQIQANLNPEPDNPKYTSAHILLEVEDDPTFEDGILTVDYTLEIKLSSDPEDADEFDDLEGEYGELSIDYVMRFDSSHDVTNELDFEHQLEVWEEEGYSHIDRSLISTFESDIVPRFFTSLDSLLGDSFIGLMPRFTFTITPDETNEEDENHEEDQE